MAVSEVAKETKAQRVERLKAELNPWTAYAEIRRFAREGRDAIPPEWLNTYLRWWGVYTQGDGVGAIGGKGGEGVATRYFMVRVRLPGGALTAHQARVLADLAERHARGVIDLTVRQNVQLHWVEIEGLPEIFETLWRERITTMGTCGDDTRNVTGCPLAGVDAGELFDASELVRDATGMLNGNADFYNLPRKFKMSITGCREWCTYPEINDVGLTAIRHPSTGEIGFSLRVGGGLSTDPHLAVRLPAFLHVDHVVPVVRGVAEIFRDSDVLRQNRDKARLKFLFLQHGWTADRFREELEKRIGFRLQDSAAEEPPHDLYRDHVGIHPQKQPGLVYAGLSVLGGRLSPGDLRGIAAIAERFGSGELRTTNMQNIIMLGIPRARVDATRQAIADHGLTLDASSFARGTVACTGSQFCKLALTETKGFARTLVEDLERRLPGFDAHLKIHVTGCPNSCGQHWIADLGIEGKKLRVDGQMVDAYYFCVGGGLGRHAAPARPIGYRVAATDVPAAIERLLRVYLKGRRGSETFRDFCRRHSDEELRGFLAGGALAAVARDPSPGRVPHAVEG
jgi:sulfite reductase (ferredoxin)